MLDGVDNVNMDVMSMLVMNLQNNGSIMKIYLYDPHLREKMWAGAFHINK